QRLDQSARLVAHPAHGRIHQLPAFVLIGRLRLGYVCGHFLLLTPATRLALPSLGFCGFLDLACEIKAYGNSLHYGVTTRTFHGDNAHRSKPARMSQLWSCVEVCDVTLRRKNRYGR